MKIGVSLKIDVTKIEKARLFEGKQGKYLDAIAFIDIDTKDQYENNGMITQAVSKDEKAAGVKGPILGNARVFYRDDVTVNEQHIHEKPKQPQRQGSMKDHVTQGAADDFVDDIPFMRLSSSYAIG